ncbi:MAG TPA: glycosyltransferase family A protein [Hymenobacter sp.]|jgi:glycosyltransferase involved in cell wall biosynthesis|uniref:glycosyltransferase family 2 protein n=1 Tax=Hymenobacter sp. TaxID=1898978 RepID=UPI002EDA7E62
MNQPPPYPEISIVTCFLNVEQYLEEAIESVIRQRYQQWELLLMDDGSMDQSTLLAKKYEALYPDKIVYLEHPGHVNKGLSASRNVAIAKSRGRLIAFLDADDVLLPDMLQQQLQLLEQHGAAMVCEASEYWHDWNDKQKPNVVIPIGTRPDHLYSPPVLALNLYPLGSGAAPCPCSILVHKEALLRHGGFEEEFPGMYEDQAFLIKFYLHEKVYISSGCHNRYRQRPDSLLNSSHREGNYLRERTKFMAWLGHYLSKQSAVHPQVSKAFRRNISALNKPESANAAQVFWSRIKTQLKRIIS